MDGCAVCKEWQLGGTRVTEEMQMCTQGTGVAQHDRHVELLLLEGYATVFIVANPSRRATKPNTGKDAVCGCHCTTL